ncbi:MAG TPA: hypothetical protein VKA60_20975 [Blastocatellia bacterium]|nr:hypothetical protein [Blastocatellia bacterium]
MINQFLSERYSEELFTVSEQEHDEVMAMIAAESENFVLRDGRVYHKPEPRSLGRIGGIEI